MLVSRIIGDCPSCGSQACFGNVSVRGDHVLRGCQQCRYSTRVPLAPIRKKVLYLDQFFFSHAFRENEGQFVQAAEKIKRLAALQLLVVPFSSVHEDETHQWRGHAGMNKDELMDFIKSTSRGHEFEPSYDVEQSQITQGFEAFLANRPDAYQLNAADALNPRVHEWDDYFRIDVGRYVGDIEFMRELKIQAVEELVTAFDEWRASTNTYEQDVAIELLASGAAYVESYLRYALRLAGGDYAAFFDAPISSQVVQALLHYLPEEQPANQRLIRIAEYFKSPHFAQLPYQWISVRIFAVLKDMVKRGAYGDRDHAIRRMKGIFADVRHVATYAPYCDAFLIDQVMGAIVADPRIDLEGRYGVRVFSRSNWDVFLTWLDSLERDIDPLQQAGLRAAYPQ